MRYVPVPNISTKHATEDGDTATSQQPPSLLTGLQPPPLGGGGGDGGSSGIGVGAAVPGMFKPAFFKPSGGGGRGSQAGSTGTTPTAAAAAASSSSAVGLPAWRVSAQNRHTKKSAASPQDIQQQEEKELVIEEGEKRAPPPPSASTSMDSGDSSQQLLIPPPPVFDYSKQQDGHTTGGVYDPSSLEVDTGDLHKSNGQEDEHHQHEDLPPPPLIPSSSDKSDLLASNPELLEILSFWHYYRSCCDYSKEAMTEWVKIHYGNEYTTRTDDIEMLLSQRDVLNKVQQHIAANALDPGATERYYC